MKYPEIYQRTHDIDYFVKDAVTSVVYHVASNGFRVPDVIDMDLNYQVQCAVYEQLRDERCRKVEVMNTRDGVCKENVYFKSFNQIASLGFVSCDKISDDEVIVVASPMSGSSSIPHIDERYLAMIPSVRVDFDYDENVNGDYLEAA